MRNIQQMIFGSFDGMVSALGVVVSAYITGSVHTLVTVSLALSVAAAASMAGGEFLSETTESKGQAYRATVMGGTTLLGAFLPAVPFLLFPKPVALSVTMLLIVVAAIVIAQLRVATHGAIRAYAQTLLILLAAGLLSVAVTLAFNLIA